MKQIVKLSDCTEAFDAKFSGAVKVQGGLKYSCGNLLKIESGGRYKLFTESRDYVKFLQGNGHFKWARGEVPFSEGDVFLAEETGEYEVNGTCVFLVLRK